MMISICLSVCLSLCPFICHQSTLGLHSGAWRARRCLQRWNNLLLGAKAYIFCPWGRYNCLQVVYNFWSIKRKLLVTRRVLAVYDIVKPRTHWRQNRLRFCRPCARQNRPSRLRDDSQSILSTARSTRSISSTIWSI